MALGLASGLRRGSRAPGRRGRARRGRGRARAARRGRSCAGWCRGSGPRRARGARRRGARAARRRAWASGRPAALAGYIAARRGTARSGPCWARACCPRARARQAPAAARRARPPPVSHRRRSGVAALAAWHLQRPAAARARAAGRRRRFTGSYDAGSFSGNDFPATSWVADHPRPLGRRRRRAGRERRAPLTAAALDRGDELTATLDCTGGFYTDAALARRAARPPARRGRRAPGATHVRVISHTGYRWSFRARPTRAACCWPRTSAASRSPTATARRAGWSRPAGAASSGSSGWSASRSTTGPTRARSPRRSGAASRPKDAGGLDRQPFGCLIYCSLMAAYPGMDEVFKALADPSRRALLDSAERA